MLLSEGSKDVIGKGIIKEVGKGTVKGADDIKENKDFYIPLFIVEGDSAI